MKNITSIKNLDLMVHGLLALRVVLLGLLFGMACAFLSFGGLFWVPAVICYFLYCMLWNTWGWAGIGHELIHNSPFRSKVWNKRYLWLSSLLSLSNKNLFFVTHFSHHQAPHAVDDFESPFNLNSGRRSNRIALTLYALVDLRKFINFIRYSILNALAIIPAPKLALFLHRKKRFYAVVSNARIILAYVVVVIAVSLVFGSVLPIFLLLVPNFIGTGFVKSLALLQHPTANLLEELGINSIEFDGSRHLLRSFDGNFLRDGIDIKMPIWVSFFYANMNYHSTHHNSFSLPFFSLPLASEANAQSGKIGRIEIDNSQVIRLCLSIY